MDLGSALFGIFSLACFIVPVVYLQNLKKKERKRFTQDFINLALQRQLVISQHDCWNHYYGIGIDILKNKLFYLKKVKDAEQEIIIDLAEVEKCSLINKSRKVQDSKVIDLLGLGFSFHNSRQPDKSLEFYNKEDSMSVNEELIISERWKVIINARLRVPSGTAGKGHGDEKPLVLI